MKKALLALSLFSALHPAAAQTPMLVEDVNTYVTAGNLNPTALHVYQNKLYFFGNEGTTGQELMMYDGTNPISQIQDLNNGNTFNVPAEPMVQFNGKLTMAGKMGSRNTLLQYDGTNPIVEAPGLSAFPSLAQLNNLTIAGGKLYFANQVTGKSAAQLFSYNGSSAPVMVNIPQSPSSTNMPSWLEEFGGSLFYSGYDTSDGLLKLFKLDPSANTPVLFTTSNFPDGFERPTHMYTVGSSMYFISAADTAGTEVFRYDGTTVTRLTNTPLIANNRPIGPLTMYNGALYYQIGGGSTGTQLFKCNPTSGASSLVYNSGSYLFQVYNGKLYLCISTPTHGQELWSNDGTNTTMVADIYPGTNSGIKDIFGVGVYNNRLYFAANNGTSGRELFVLNAPTAIASVAGTTGVIVFPNPGSDNITMELTLKQPGSVVVTLCDASGRQVSAIGPTHYAEGINRLTIPMQSLATGRYYYRLSSSDGRLLAAGSITRQ